MKTPPPGQEQHPHVAPQGVPSPMWTPGSPAISPANSQSSGPSYMPPSPMWEETAAATEHQQSEEESGSEVKLPEVPDEEGKDIIKKITSIKR